MTLYLAREAGGKFPPNFRHKLNYVALGKIYDFSCETPSFKVSVEYTSVEEEMAGGKGAKGSLSQSSGKCVTAKYS